MIDARKRTKQISWYFSISGAQTNVQKNKTCGEKKKNPPATATSMDPSGPEVIKECEARWEKWEVTFVASECQSRPKNIAKECDV